MIYDQLHDAIMNKDKTKTLELFEALAVELSQDPKKMVEFVHPTTITELHTLLMENFGMTKKQLAVRRGVPSVRTRAYMMLKAMEIGVRRSNV